MRLKFAVASATGRTRCGEFVYQKDERKPIVLVISELKPPVEKWERKGFLLLPSNFLGAPRARESFRSSLVRRRLTFLAAAFHATLK
jgi:hypothetical protein